MISVTLHAQKKWIGLSAAWDDAVNWSPAGPPQALDDVILDNTMYPASYIVHLPDALVTVHSIKASPAPGNTIQLILPVTNLKSPAMVLSSPTDALILQKGSVLVNASGISSGTSIQLNGLIRIENGGRYVHKSRSVHAGDIVAKLAAGAGTENGIFEFDVPGGAYPVSLSNRTYGKLLFSAEASGGSQTYNASGSSMVTIRGDLEIQAGVQLNLDVSKDVIVTGRLLQQGGVLNLASQANSNTFQLHGDLQQSPGGVITETGSGLPVLALSGQSGQRVSVAGSIEHEVTLLINNANGVVLDADLRLMYKLQFALGKLKSSAATLLVLGDTCKATGASRDSFVDGPVKKIGDTDFEFPVGKQHDYAPIGITGDSGNKTDEYIAEYFLADPRVRYGTAFEAPMIRVSSMEYWFLKKVHGGTAKKVQLTVGAYSGATALDKLVIAQWDEAAARWRNAGNSAWDGVTAGYVASNEIMPDGPFTVASTVAQQNPLPAINISLRADEKDNTVLLTWFLHGDAPAGLFQVEQSADGQVFNAIRVVAGEDFRREYQAVVRLPQRLKRYFRIHFADPTGNDLYSPLVAVYAEDHDFTCHVARSRLDLFLRLPGRQQVQVVIFDLAGKQVKSHDQPVEANGSHVFVDISGLVPGLYILNVKGRDRIIKVCLFAR